jgi:hypothetical protein
MPETTKTRFYKPSSPGHFVVIVGPLGDDPPGGVELRLLRQRVVAQVDAFGRLL